LLECVCPRIHAGIRKLVDTRAELVGFVRLLRNVRVTPEKIVAAAAKRTAQAVAGRSVLLIEDTTEINYEAKRGRKRGLGQVGNGKDIGLFLHPVVAVDAEDGSVLGLAGARIWRRTKTKSATYQADPIETKESFRWIEVVAQAKAAVPLATRTTVVADREADIFELMARLPPLGVDILIRSNHDRALSGRSRTKKPDGLPRRLLEALAAWPQAGQISLDLPARTGRAAQRIDLAVRFGPVTLHQPRQGADLRDPNSVTLNIVEVKQINPPPPTDTDKGKGKGKSKEQPIVWRLLTTHAVTSMAEATHIVELYRRRWTIEQVFRTLKSQAIDLEESLLAEGDALERLAITTMSAAIIVMQLVSARGTAGQSLPATRVFSSAEIDCLHALTARFEGKTDKQKNHHPPESLAWAAWHIARMGGWTGYATERPPGPITFANGLKRFFAIAEGFAIGKNGSSQKDVCRH
jgi:hypothetical protein